MCGNGLNIVSFYGYNSGAPYLKHNIQQLQLSYAGGASVALNLAGCSIGDDGSDNILIKSNGVTRIKVWADGGITVHDSSGNAPTGNSKGAGTINVATGLYVNNVAVTVP